MASSEARQRGEELADSWERTGVARCSGDGATRAGLDGPSCVVIAQAGGEGGQILKATLEQSGFEVVPAEDGVAALELVCAVGPDAIIADLDGRGLDGLVLCQVLRGLRAHATLPVLMLTADHGDAARARTLAALGGVRVIHKPAGSAAVAGALSEMIKVAGGRATQLLSPQASR